MEKVKEIYERLIEEYGVNEELLQVITYINGFNIDTLNDVIYVKFGYRDFEQLSEEEEEF